MVVVVALPGTYCWPICFVSSVDEVQNPNHTTLPFFPRRFLSTTVVRKRYRDLWAFISLIWLSSSTCWICTWKQILENKKLSRNSSWLFIQKRCDNQLNFYPNNLLLSPKKGWKMISMLLVWDPTTKLEFSFKIIRSDFVEEVEKRLTEAWEFRDTSSQKDAGCGLALLTRWTGPTQVTLACLP